MIKEPKIMKAPNESIKFSDPRIKWPMYVSRKYDGFRILVREGELLTSSLKSYGNQYLVAHLRDIIHESKIPEQTVFDGELFDESMEFSELSSILRSRSKRIPLTLRMHVFDAVPWTVWHGLEVCPTFEHRYRKLIEIIETRKPENVKLVSQLIARYPEDARAMHEQFLGEGYEGSMLKCPQGFYKHGRATLKQSMMFKMKEFVPSDGVIVEVLQAKRMKEEVQFGERTRDVMGHRERSHKKDDYELVESAGSLKVQMKDGVTVGIGFGRGRNHADRIKIWEDRESYVGMQVEFEYQEHGSKDRPRIGKLLRFRPDLD